MPTNSANIISLTRLGSTGYILSCFGVVPGKVPAPAAPLGVAAVARIQHSPLATASETSRTVESDDTSTITAVSSSRKA